MTTPISGNNPIPSPNLTQSPLPQDVIDQINQSFVGLNNVFLLQQTNQTIPPQVLNDLKNLLNSLQNNPAVKQDDSFVSGRISLAIYYLNQMGPNNPEALHDAMGQIGVIEQVRPQIALSITPDQLAQVHQNALEGCNLILSNANSGEFFLGRDNALLVASYLALIPLSNPNFAKLNLAMDNVDNGLASNNQAQVISNINIIKSLIN